MTRQEKRNELQRRREVRMASGLLRMVERKNKMQFTDEILDGTEIYFSKEEGKKQALVAVKVPHGFFICQYKIVCRYFKKFMTGGLLPSTSKTFSDHVHDNENQYKLFLKGLDNGEIKKIF